MKERFFLKRNFIIIFSTLLLAIVFAASGALAYYYWTPKPSDTRPGFKFEIDNFILDPNRDDGVNPTSTRCYVRATIYKFWYYIDEENLESGNNSRIQIIYYGHNNNSITDDDYDKATESQPYNKDIIDIELNLSDKWTKLSDGFYYYNSILEVNKPEDSTSPTEGSVPEKLVNGIVTGSQTTNVGEQVHPGYYVVYEYLAVDEQNIGDQKVSSPENAWKAKFNESGTWSLVNPPTTTNP